MILSVDVGDTSLVLQASLSQGMLGQLHLGLESEEVAGSKTRSAGHSCRWAPEPPSPQLTNLWQSGG